MMKDEHRAEAIMEKKRNSIFNDMKHEQVMEIMKEGLHHLTTIDLVTLHSEISKVQIESSHLREDESKG